MVYSSLNFFGIFGKSAVRSALFFFGDGRWSEVFVVVVVVVVVVVIDNAM
jgi:hypothetical protein